jgi:lysyl endopeptidase
MNLLCAIRAAAIGCALLFSVNAMAMRPSVADLDQVPLHVVPQTLSSKAIAAAEANKGAGPYPIAANVDLPVSLDGGVWDRSDDGRARWRARAYSAGAQMLILEFRQFALPTGAELWIYDADGQSVRGPFTQANETADGSLWTPWIAGDTAVIELRVQDAERDAVALELGKLAHGFRNARDLGDSGACNIDTACSQGNNWRAEIRSAVKLQIPATLTVGLCSGTLVNTVRGDGTPYVLTANHCGIGTLGSPASGVITYFNFENSSCGGADDASDAQSITGSTLRANDSDTDFALIELSSAPPSSYNVYYSGWDAGGSGGSSGAGLHHPSGDAKKISIFTQSLQASSVQLQLLGPDIPAWRVPSWSQGVTEPGSSGSGLWNQNHRLVGTLSGGSSGCDGNTGNGLDDYYARIDKQWKANADAAGQLKAWLDPDNSGQTEVSGRNPGSSSGGGSGDDSSSGGGGGGGLNPAMLLVFSLLALMQRRTRRH